MIDFAFVGNTADFGGAIYNAANSTVNLRAKEGHSISFVGLENDPKADTVHNLGNLNINTANGTETYTGVVNFKDITDNAIASGIMTINAGDVNILGSVKQKEITLKNSSANLHLSGKVETGTNESC